MARKIKRDAQSRQQLDSLRREMPRQIGIRPFRRQLRIELLEARQLLAVVTVNTLEDKVDFNDGATSLREAIFATNLVGGADTIEFSASLTSGGPATLTLVQGELKITDTLVINGPGTNLLTIDASGNDPTPDSNYDDGLFNDGDGSRVFSINDGSSDNFLNVSIGGLMLTGGDVDGNGGAIQSFEHLTVTDSTISGNLARYSGGGIYSFDGDLTVILSTISNNSTYFNGTGGGIFSGSLLGVANHVTLTDSTISGNSAGFVGGGIFNASVNGDLTVTGTKIEGNSAGGSGGGIFTTHGNATITDSTISGNSAGQGGGGVFSRYGLVTVTDSTISGNSADGGATQSGGGGISSDGDLIVTRSTISGNVANLNGGGIYSRSGDMTIVDSTVSDNSSDHFMRHYGTNGGGGIFHGFGHVTVTGSTIVRNSSVLSDGGGISGPSGQLTITNSSVSSNSAAGVGGGIASAIVTVSGSTISFNSATEGGGIWGSTVTVTDSSLDENRATNNGGGIYSSFTGLTMIGSTLSNNQARNGNGGGVYVFNAMSSIRHSTVTANSAAHSAGGGAFIAGGKLTLDHTILAGNSAWIGPDLTGFIGTIFDAHFSLLGNNAGSGLAATPTRTPDANGNLIGPAVPIESLMVNIQVAAMGDFEAGPGGDSFVFEYSIDGGAFQPLFTSSVDEAISQTYVMDKGTSVVLDDPLSINGVVLNRQFQWISAAIPGGGSQIQIRFTATNDGPNEAFAWRNLHIYGQDSGATVGHAGGSQSSIDKFAAYVADADYTIAGDMFGIRSRPNPGIPGLPVDIVDNSATIMPIDVQGIIGRFDVDRFFGVVDTVNGVGSDTNTAMWTFNNILVPIDPLLGPLDYNDGPTAFYSLLPGSPAIDMGNPAAVAGENGVPLYDQRGTPHARVLDGDVVVGARIDIGAFELQPTAPALLGDYNQNGEVDAADFIVWRSTNGNAVSPYSGADGDGNGIINQADCDVWSDHFGQTLLLLGVGNRASIATISTQFVATSGGLAGTQTSLNTLDGGPKEVVESLGANAERFAPSSSLIATNRRTRYASIGAGSTLSSGHRDEALATWLASQTNTTPHRETFEESDSCERKNESADDLHLDAFDQVFAELVSR